MADAASRFLCAFLGGDVLETLAQEYCGKNAEPDDDDGNDHRQVAGTRDDVAKNRQIHDCEKIGRDHVGDIAEKVLDAHEARAFVIVRREFITKRDPRRCIDGVRKKKDQ